MRSPVLACLAAACAAFVLLTGAGATAPSALARQRGAFVRKPRCWSGPHPRPLSIRPGGEREPRRRRTMERGAFARSRRAPNRRGLLRPP